MFGSCARGDERPDSDVDLLVNYTDSDSLSLMDITRMMIHLGKNLHRKVDLVEDEYLKPFARESVNRDKIKIYERAPEIQAKTFYDVKRRIPVYVPDESVDTYKDNSLWGEFDIQGISNRDDAIENIGLDPSVAPVKIFYGSQLLILRDGKTYTLQGQQLK